MAKTGVVVLITQRRMRNERRGSTGTRLLRITCSPTPPRSLETRSWSKGRVRDDVLPHQSRPDSRHLLFAPVGLNPPGRGRHDFNSVPQPPPDLEHTTAPPLITQ